MTYAVTAPAPRVTYSPALIPQAEKSAEGSWRGPFYGMGEFGGMFELSPIEDGFQRNLDVRGWGVRQVPAAFAAVMANAKAVSQCSPSHMRETSKKGQFDRVTTSPAFRVFRAPNDYETWPVFILNMVAQMQFDGTAYAVALRNDRGDIQSLHRLPTGGCFPYIDPTTGEIFYTLGMNQMIPTFRGSIAGAEYMVPARDVIALRQYCPRHPLMGETPFAAAAMALGVNVALSRSQAIFFSRMSRPSGVLVSDQQLNREQIQRLRENWESQASKLAQGGVPILGNGVKWVPMVISSEDAQLIDAQRLSIEDIARVCGVPLPVIGDLSHATLTNVESLVSFWLATSLGSMLDLIERAFDKLFGFDNVSEFVDLDQNALLRTDLSARIDAYTKGIQGGLYAPNEARAREGLHPVPGGDKVYVQAQMTPLGEKPAEPPAPAPAPAPAAGDQPNPDDAPDAAGDGSKDLSAEDATAALLQRVMTP